MYRVQYLDHDTWIEHSSHRNQEYADIQFDLVVKKNKNVRMLHEGKIVKETKNA